MTQPVQEPSQGRQVAGLEFRTRQLFRRPSPAPPAASGWMPQAGWAPIPVRVPWTEKYAKLPGGVVTVQAAEFCTGATKTSPAHPREQFSVAVASHSQTAANAAAAASSVEIPVDSIGLVPGRLYNVLIGLKADTTAVGAQINWDVASRPAGASTSAYYPGGFYFTGNNPIPLRADGEYYGLFAPEFDTGSGYSRLNWWYAAGETITIKAFKTSGTGGVQIDCIHFLPQDQDPFDSVDLGYWDFQYWNTLRVSADLGTTASYKADGNFPRGTSAGNNCMADTQQVANPYAAQISAAGYGNTPPVLDVHDSFASPYPDQMKYGGHTYIVARGSGDTEFLECGFVTPFLNSGAMPTCAIAGRSAGLYYLGRYIEELGTDWTQIAAWIRNATNTGGGGRGAGSDNTAIANVDVRVSEIFQISDKFTEWSLYYDNFPAV